MWTSKIPSNILTHVELHYILCGVVIVLSHFFNESAELSRAIKSERLALTMRTRMPRRVVASSQQLAPYYNIRSDFRRNVATLYCVHMYICLYKI